MVPMLYSIQFLHQITTENAYNDPSKVLYSIQFLHQITTCWARFFKNGCCIVSNFYIKSQRSGGSANGTYSCIVSNFYIKSQRQFVDK